MRKWILLFVLLLMPAVALLLAQKPAPRGPDPLVVAGDTHKPAFENKFVRVIETKLPPGSHEPRHYHPHGVVVYLTDFEVRASEEGKAAVIRQRKGGTAVWSEALVHEIDNVGKTPGHVFRIELKS